jgi:hypothetical protein
MRRLEPRLKPGRVYRTKDFGAWAKNPFALAARLVAEGRLQHLGHGLYFAPEQSRFGPLPPDEHELVSAFLCRRPFVFSGTDAWNALALGTTQASMVALVYNENRSGLFVLDGRRYQFKRTRFPERPSAEWFAVDFLNNLDDVVDADPERNLRALRQRLQRDLDPVRFAAALTRFGSRRAKALAQKHHLLDLVEQPHAA